MGVGLAAPVSGDFELDSDAYSSSLHQHYNGNYDANNHGTWNQPDVGICASGLIVACSCHVQRSSRAGCFEVYCCVHWIVALFV